MTPTINVARIQESIQQLQQHLNPAEIADVLALLETMAEQPQDPNLLEQLGTALDRLGILQGAVLTYAPYLAVILAGRAFKNTGIP